MKKIIYYLLVAVAVASAGSRVSKFPLIDESIQSRPVKLSRSTMSSGNPHLGGRISKTTFDRPPPTTNSKWHPSLSSTTPQTGPDLTKSYGNPSSIKKHEDDRGTMKSKDKQQSTSTTTSTTTTTTSLKKSPLSLLPTSESLEGTFDLSFYDSLISIIKVSDRTFIPTLTAEQFLKYISGEHLLEVLSDRSVDIGLRHDAIDRMLTIFGQKSNNATRKNIREAVVEWIDWAYRLHVTNVVKVRECVGFTKSPKELEGMFRNLLTDPFSVDHHNISSPVYVKMHKYIALFLVTFLAHLKDEKTRFEELVKEHGLPPVKGLKCFRDFMMRDILLLWNFLAADYFDSTLSQLFHQNHPDTFALNFRPTLMKLMANFDFPSTFLASKAELARSTKPPKFKDYEEFISKQPGGEHGFWSRNFGADTMHAGGTFFFLARSEFIKNVAESFLDAFIEPFYAQEVRLDQFTIPLIDSPIIAVYMNKFFFPLIHKESRVRATHFLASMLDDWITPGTKLSELTADYTELAIGTKISGQPEKMIHEYGTFRLQLESILKGIKEYLPRTYLRVDRRARTGNDTSGDGTPNEGTARTSSSSSSGSSNSSNVSSSTRIPPSSRDYFIATSFNNSSIRLSSTQKAISGQRGPLDDGKRPSKPNTGTPYPGIS